MVFNKIIDINHKNILFHILNIWNKKKQVRNLLFSCMILFLDEFFVLAA